MKKWIVKWIAATMAMTMVMGSGLTAFAEETSSSCEHAYNVLSQDPDSKVHTLQCAYCQVEKTESCSSQKNLYKWWSEGEHALVCDVCEWQIGELEAHTLGENGLCSLCGGNMSEQGNEVPEGLELEKFGFVPVYGTSEQFLDGWSVEIDSIKPSSSYTIPVKPAVSPTKVEGFDIVPIFGSMAIQEGVDKIAEYVDVSTSGLHLKFKENVKAGDVITISYKMSGVELVKEDGRNWLADEQVQVKGGKYARITIKIVDKLSTEEPKDEPVQETPAETPQEAPTAEEIQEMIVQQVEERTRTEEAMPVTTFNSTEAVNAIPTEAKDAATTTDTYNLSQVTTVKGFVAAVNKIAQANTATTTVAVYTSSPMTFNAESLASVVDTNKEFVYLFRHNGHLYKVTIPAGAKIDLNGQRFAGPLYIGAQLGTSELLK